MAIYYEPAYQEGPFYDHRSVSLVARTTSRSYVTADTIRLFRIERDQKVAEAVISSSASLGATATFDLQVTDGTTTVKLIVGAALTAADVFTRLNRFVGHGYIIPTRGFWVELLASSIVTPTAGIIGVTVQFTGLMFGSESPLNPPGS